MQSGATARVDAGRRLESAVVGHEFRQAPQIVSTLEEALSQSSPGIVMIGLDSKSARGSASR